MTTIADALNVLRPGAEWVIQGDRLEWLDKVQTAPTTAEINAEISRQEALPPPTLADRMDVVQFKIAFNHENRIRVLEGKNQITVAQFKTALTQLLGG